MPFTKVGKNDYTSPSGRHFNSAQVRLYYAHGGKFPGEKHMAQGGLVEKSDKGGPDPRLEFTARPLDAPMTKGSAPRHLDGAKGGPVLKEGPSMFIKGTKDSFRTDAGRQDYGGGKDPLANPKGDGKIMPVIKPRT